MTLVLALQKVGNMMNVLASLPNCMIGLPRLRLKYPLSCEREKIIG
jgi:hypothetical protein